MTFDTEADPPEPPRIRALRRLVTVLTVTMILGMVIITGLITWRLTASAPTQTLAPTRTLPETIALPAGETLTGYAMNPDWTVLITTDATGGQRLHLVPAGMTEIHQTVAIQPPG